MTDEQAFDAMRAVSQIRHTKLRDLAERCPGTDTHAL